MGVDLPGCFAKYAVAPARFVWALPDSISDEDGATIEPLAVALHALDQSRASEGDSVAVVGCGGIGQLLIHAARARGVRVLADDQSEAKLERARQLGAITTARGTDTARLWREMEVSAVFECAGSSSAVERAIDTAPRGGKVLLLGLSSSLASFVPLHLVRKGVRIEPSLIYDHPVDFARAIDLVAEGTLHPSCVVSSAFPFDEIGHAFEVACAGPESKVHSLIL
jgi:threonine dehydrogenase-like Zn-dependent dehydrogenase